MSKSSTNAQNKTKGVVQDILVIMDSSGSMQSMGNEPLQALNGFIKDQQEVLSGDGSTLSLWMFDTKTHLVIDDQPLKDVAPVTAYRPDGMTAMYDAIGKAVSLKYNKSKRRNVVCMVITDGEENASVEYALSDVRKVIDTAEKEHGWKFIFIGATDIFAEGAKTGFDINRCAAYAPSVPGMLAQISREVSSNVAHYRCVTSQGIEVDLKLRQSEMKKDSDDDTDGFVERVVPPPPALTRRSSVV